MENPKSFLVQHFIELPSNAEQIEDAVLNDGKPKPFTADMQKACNLLLMDMTSVMPKLAKLKQYLGANKKSRSSSKRFAAKPNRTRF
jgi:hypothetical protein